MKSLSSLFVILCLTAPAYAEGGFEMFEEICEITGEVKTSYHQVPSEIKLSDIEIKTRTLLPVSSQSL